MMNPAVEKQSLRTQMKRKLQSLSEEKKSFLSQGICTSLKTELASHAFQTIAVFAPTEDEPNIWSVIEWLFEQQKTVVFPSWQSDSQCLQFFVVEKREDLAASFFGIFQPRPHGAAVNPRQIDVMMVPGVAFDQQGNRLGRGKGYYDHYLSLLRENCVTIGVCFPLQLVKTVPIAMHDRPVNIVKCGN